MRRLEVASLVVTVLALAVLGWLVVVVVGWSAWILFGCVAG